MKALIAIAIAAIVAGIAWALYTQWLEVSPEEDIKPEVRILRMTGQELSGLPSALEGPLASAQAKGAPGLRRFLAEHRYRIRDPRLAKIELDYVVLVAQRDPAEARLVFVQVRDRVPKDSPVYPLIEALSATYGE